MLPQLFTFFKIMYSPFQQWCCPRFAYCVDSRPINSILQGTLRFSAGRMELPGLIESRGETGATPIKSLV